MDRLIKAKLEKKPHSKAQKVGKGEREQKSSVSFLCANTKLTIPVVYWTGICLDCYKNLWKSRIHSPL